MMIRKICPYDNQTLPHPCSSGSADAEHLHCVGASHSHVPPPTTSRLDVAHAFDHFQPSNLSFVPRRGESCSSPRLTHPSYSLSRAGIGVESPNETPPDWGIPDLRQLEMTNSWGLFYPPPNMPPNAMYGSSPPALHHSTAGPTLYPDAPGPRSWSTTDMQISPADGSLPALGYYHPPAYPPHNASSPPNPYLGSTSELYSGTLDAPTPHRCLWTENGSACNTWVQATRSYVNRHLHACHGFTGPDTQPMSCRWAGCGETMQQGSIARHMVSRHLQVKVTCSMCSKKLSRQDVISKHQRVCPAASAWR